MTQIYGTPSIEVTIGRQTRLYHAFITTAPATLDAPSTVTLYVGPLKDVAGLASEELTVDTTPLSTPKAAVGTGTPMKTQTPMVTTSIRDTPTPI